MATDQKPDVEERPATSRWRDWRSFVAGVIFGCLVPFAVAFFGGPRSAATYEDSLTGRYLRESTWLGMTLCHRVEENEVSQWADRNSIEGSYPAQYGWTVVTREERGWFSGSTIACGGGFNIPNQIFNGQIAIEGLTREETLRRYQAELVASFNEHGSIIGAQRKWQANKK